MPLTPGAKLGSYVVVEAIGAGGMGEVYKARDTRLDRSVAIKVLPEAFALDKERLARFEREAKLLASLNHPNIATIHGLEESHGQLFLTMELVDGETLSARLAHGPIALDEAIPIARQIANGLEAAHERGIIHRDLKPGNVMVREDGTVKVLDFGLAKALEGGEEGNPSESPTMSAAATRAGVIMGTAAYMSPEQARGKRVDKRADIWSFGVVLIEMLTGKRAFVGEDVSLTLAAVMKSEPDWSALPRGISPVLRTYLVRCLKKDPRERVRDIGDVRLAMEGAFDTEGETVGTDSAATWPWLAAIVVATLVTGVVVWSVTWSTPPGPRALVRFVVDTPDGPLRGASGQPDVAISPDGNRIVYNSSAKLYVRAFDEPDAVLLQGSEGARSPFFSPDGEWVGFSEVINGTLKKVSVRGGPSVRITDAATTLGMSWGPDDTIVFATVESRGLLRVPSAGGEPEVLTTVDAGEGEFGHFWPEVLPNGKTALFTAWTGTDESSRVAVVSLATGEVSYLFQGGSYPRYSPTGHIVYGVDGTLRAVGFDPERLEVTGSPTPVLENVNMEARGIANFSLSRGGSLVYVTGGDSDRIVAQRTLVWVDRHGREEPLAAEPRDYRHPDVSSDGRIAVSVMSGVAEDDIWIYDAARDTSTRLTFEGLDIMPRWSPDGQQIVFTSNRVDGITVNLFSKSTDGTGAVERLVTRSTTQFPGSWSSDGKRLLFSDCTGQCDLWVLVFSDEPTAAPLLQTEFHERDGAFSPDGGWIAYRSDASGRNEIYVRPFPNVDDEPYQVSTDGGVQPVWGPDGKELFYWSDAGLMAVAVETDPTFRRGNPEVLFVLDDYTFHVLRNYALAPDGERFLMIKKSVTANDAPASAPKIHVVLNWGEELKRLVP